MAATTARTRAQSALFPPGATSPHCVLSAGTAGQSSVSYGWHMRRLRCAHARLALLAECCPVKACVREP
eukprot:5753914-Prymnesium_polylepis.1